MILRASKFLAGILTAALLVLGGAFVTSAPAAAADKSYWLTNSSSNSSSFDCYVYLKGKWNKLNDGKTQKKMSTSTPFKCNKDWYATSITGAALTGTLEKNHVYKWSNTALRRLKGFDWAVAFQK